MNVINRITIDLLGNGRAETVHVVQGDAYSRTVDIDLRQWRTPWTIPEGVSIVVEYYKPDGTKGLYDKLPDGTPAWSAAGNILTIQLAPQMLTVSGTVVAQVRMMKADAVLSLFKFNVFVHQKITGNGSEDYTNWNKLFLPQVNGATVGKYLEIEEVDEDGKVTKLRPTNGPQGDWNASQNSPGHIKNRTHYEESTFKTVPIPGVWESYKVASGETHWIYQFTEPLNLVDGARYTVTFGTQGYQCTARKGDKYISLNNVGIPSIPENFQFVIFANFEKQADGYWGDLSMMDGSKSDFTIYENKTIVHKLDEKYLPDSIATKKYVDTAIKNIDIPEPETAQPDWNAVEGEPGHVLNRTHWVEKSGFAEIPIVGEWGEVDMDGDGISDSSVLQVFAPIGLQIGNTYTVKCNGTDYEVIGQDMSVLSGGEMPGVFLGNLAGMGGEDTGEPFVIMEISEELSAEMGGMYGAIQVMGAVESFAIYGESEDVHKLPNKFIDSDWVKNLVAPSIATAKSEAVTEANEYTDTRLNESKVEIPLLDLNAFFSSNFEYGDEYSTSNADKTLCDKIRVAGIVKVRIPDSIFGHERFITVYPLVNPSGVNITIVLSADTVSGEWQGGKELGVIDINYNLWLLKIKTGRIAVSATI